MKAVKARLLPKVQATTNFFRWRDGPRVNGVEPILVIFEERKEKELVWTKLRDNLKTKEIF